MFMHVRRGRQHRHHLVSERHIDTAEYVDTVLSRDYDEGDSYER
jgi:hypothetical protein